MSLPSITLRTVTTPTVSNPGVFDTWAYIGVSTSGTVNEPTSTSSVTDLVDTFGDGPMVECARFSLENNSNGIVVVKATADVSASISSVTTGSLNTPSGSLTVNTSTPYSSYDGIVTIAEAGTIGTGSFKYSLDGGDTYSEALELEASYTVPNSGIVLAFSGTFAADETFSFTAVGPRFTTTSLNNALDALIASSLTVNKIHIVGEVKSTDDAASATAAAAIAAAVQVKLNGAESGKKWIQAVMDGCDVANSSAGDSAVTAAFANISAPRVMMSQGFCELVTQTGTYRRPTMWSAGPLMRGLPYWQSPHCPARGALQGVLSLERDENNRQGMNDNRITSFRTIPGANGFFITEPLMLYSDANFKWMYNLAIMDRAKYLTHQILLSYLNEQLPVLDTGVIEPVTRATIESNVTNTVGEIMKSDGAITEFLCKVNDKENFQATETLKVDIGLRIKGTAKFIVASLAVLKK